MFFHALENLTWYCVGVGLTGCVSMWVLVVYCRMFCSSCGVCKFDGRFIWLYMHIIVVSSGSTRW